MDDARVMERFRSWDQELARHDRIEVGLRRRRVVLMTLLSLAFAAVGGLMAAGGTGSDLVWGWACLILFFGGSLVLARQGMRRGPAVVITSRDIESQVHHWSVPWPVVRGAFVF
ncbi:MAG: hypothetical protein ACJ72P_05565, partial [Nocardioides sp.]